MSGICKVHQIYFSFDFSKMISSTAASIATKQRDDFSQAQNADTVTAPLYLQRISNSKKYLFTSGDDGKLLHFRDFSDEDEFPILMIPVHNAKSHNPLQWHAICANRFDGRKTENGVLFFLMHGIRFSVRLIHPVASLSLSSREHSVLRVKITPKCATPNTREKELCVIHV